MIIWDASEALEATSNLLNTLELLTVKYKMRAKETFETVTPASEMIFRSIVTGQEVGKRLPVPESKYLTVQGSIYIAKNKAEMTRLLQSGKWELIKQ